MSVRIAVHVLDLCNDQQTKCLWKHVWVNFGDTIEKDLHHRNISISSDYASSDPMAISYGSDDISTTDMQTRIRGTFVGLIQVNSLQIRPIIELSMKQDQIDAISKQFAQDKVGIYINDNCKNSVWVVGHTLVLDEVVKCLKEKLHPCSIRTSAYAKLDTLKSSREKEETQVFVQLSEEDQAIVWIYDLLNLKSFKQDNVAISHHHFGLEILVPDINTKQIIENELKSTITNANLAVSNKTYSFSDCLYQLIQRDTIHAFLQFRLRKHKCVWFKNSQNTVTLYAENQSKINVAYGVIKGSFKVDIIAVPSRFFSSENAIQKITNLEEKANGKLLIKLSTDFSTVNVSRTDDYWFNLTQIEYMYTSKRLLIPKQKQETMKKLLSYYKSSIENQFSVNIYEQDDPLCKWTVKGEDSAVEAAYQELLKLQQMPGQDKTYIIDDKVTDLQLGVTNIADSCWCCVSLSSVKVHVAPSELRTKPVDLRQHIRCRSITVDDGFTVKLYKCSLQNKDWLGQNTLILNVGHSAGGDTSTIKCMVNAFQQDHACICLPIWKIAKQNDNLRKLMTEMTDYFKSAKLQGHTVMSLDLTLVEKVGWPVVQFLGAILLSLNCSRPTCFQFFAPSDNIFEPSSDIINQWCQLKKGSSKQKLKINIVKGELALMKCDVLVNATNREFDLSRGMVSKALLKAAGIELQHDCNSTLKCKQIEFSEVVVTGGYNLTAKKIFHGVLPRYKSESSMQQFEYFIKNCLNTAVDLNMRSIAFPALGTGNLLYPSNLVASSMFLVANKFISAYNVGSLTEINFVIYPADIGVLQVFEAEEKHRNKTVGNMFVDSVVACPDFTTCTVQVIGPSDELILDTFKQIEESFNTNGITDEGVQTNRLAQLIANDKQDSKYPKGDIQYLQYLLNATEDISSDSFDKRQSMAYNSSNNFSKPDTLWINDKKLPIPQLTPMGSPILYRPKQDSIVMITKEGVKVFVYKADICYLSKVDCIVHPFIRRMYEIDGLTNIVARAGEQMKKECSQFVAKHGDLRAKRVWITTAGNLTNCKKILHVKAPLRNEYSTIDAFSESISETIRICLSRANTNGITSIAFSPFTSLGLDKACTTDMVKTYPESVMKYSTEAGVKSNIKEIHFVHTDQSEVEAIHSVFLQTIPDRYDNKYIKQKDRATELLGNVEMNEFNYKPSENLIDGIKNIKMCRYRPGLISGDIQYQQCRVNATEDLRADSFNKSKSLAPASKYLLPNGRLRINDNKIKSCQSSLRSTNLYRPRQDSVIMITKEGINVFVYKANICYLRNVDCIVNPSSSKLNETVGLTNIILEAGEKVKTECTRYIQEYGSLREKCVCITTAGNLTHYKKILHVMASVRNEYVPIELISENISAAIHVCLSQANIDNMTSIALPPLITLGCDTVWNTSIVKTYLESVIKYSAKAGLRSSIKEIHFVHTDQSEVEAIHSAFLQTIPDSYADEHVKRKERTRETLKYADRNEFQTFQTNTDTLQFPISGTISDKTGKCKMYQSMPDLFSDSSENVPSNWTGMDANDMITTVILQPHDQEYKDVVDEFKQTSGRHYDIIKVQRIQNKALHQQYISRKKLMDSINPSCFNNERKLWHGTTLEAVNGINTYGFNRGYCGKNAASYGNGVYFAVNSSYSSKSQYSTPDNDNIKRIYLCKVLVGEYAKGQQDMRVPPQKYGASGSHILYDSVVDNPSSPRIFVIFHDAQAYPEYLIVFR
ncbi:uncharacterized protein LOC134693839 [Mytilus trossulus]|uniref:uncharacterized protein LOC134693839 n=1 Tax=Mytilus trossulus TaxID=6551 RepID=UPI003006EFF5